MRVPEYLEITGTSAKALAKQAGLHEQTIFGLIHGKHIPGMKILQRLYIATKGKVDANSYLEIQ